MSLRLLVAVFFGTSTMVAALKCLGTVHVDKDRLKMFHQVSEYPEFHLGGHYGAADLRRANRRCRAAHLKVSTEVV